MAQLIQDGVAVANDSAAVEVSAQQRAERKEYVFTDEQTRANAIAAVAKMEVYPEVVAALEADLDHTDRKELSDIAHTLGEAMKATWPPEDGRKQGKWVFYGFVRDEMRTVKEKAYELSNVIAEEGVMRFLENLGWAFRMVLTARICKENVGAIRFQLHAARPAEHWAQWSLKAVERMVNNNDTRLVECAGEGFLTHIRSSAPEGQRAIAFINGLQARVASGLEQFSQDQKKAKTAKEVERRARQLARSKSGPHGRVDSKPQQGSAKLGQRARHDPHYRGPGKKGK